MRLSRDATAIRALAVGLVAALSSLTWAAAPDPVTRLSAVGAIVATLFAALFPSSVMATFAVLALAAGFTSAASTEQIRLTVVPLVGSEAAALWSVHALFALAAAVPHNAVVEHRALRQNLARLSRGAIISAAASSVPLGVALTVEEPSAALRVAGIVAAASAAAVPAYLIRARR